METGKIILIIDDDLDFQWMVGSALRKVGYEVKSQLEGKTDVAWAAARECDLVLLDIRLPGVNGVEIGKELKSSTETTHIPVILLSGLKDCSQMFIESQADVLIKKPFSLSRLMKKVQELLHIKDNPPAVL
jgi:DNA-binding response OmpR family regulator